MAGLKDQVGVIVEGQRYKLRNGRSLRMNKPVDRVRESGL